MSKPIQMGEAPPHPWRVAIALSGSVFIYGEGESQPLEILRRKKRRTRRELATLQLIVDAVNDFRRRNPQFQKVQKED